MLLKKQGGSARTLALGGVLLAVSVTLVLLASVIPTGKLALLSLASFTVAIVVMESGPGTAWIYYLASSLLLFILVANKAVLLVYILFFGFYGIVKYYAERGSRNGRLRHLAEMAAKLAVFAVCAPASALATSVVTGIALDQVLGKLEEKLAGMVWPLTILILVLVFLVYDLAFTLFIGYYRDHLRKRSGNA